MQKAARKEGLLSILGCEFSTVEYGVGFHLLGFDFNPEAPEIKAFLKRGAGKQRARTELLLKWAHEKGRIPEVTWEEVCEAYPYNDYICNNHVFRVLVTKGALREEDYFSFFDPDFKWNPVTERRIEAEIGITEPSTKDVIAAIRKAGGVPILAHPHDQFQYVMDLKEAGLMGVEANHPELTDQEVEMYNAFADQQGMYKTGGTDHSGVLGGYEWLEPARAADNRRNSVQEKDFMNLYQRRLG